MRRGRSGAGRPPTPDAYPAGVTASYPGGEDIAGRLLPLQRIGARRFLTVLVQEAGKSAGMALMEYALHEIKRNPDPLVVHVATQVAVAEILHLKWHRCHPDPAEVMLDEGLIHIVPYLT